MDQPLVRITTLGGPPLELAGRLADRSGQHVGVVTVQPLALGLSVQVESDSFLLLGEVWRSKPQGTEFYTAIRIEHVMAEAQSARMLAMVRRAAATGQA